MTFIAGEITSTGLVVAPLTGTSEAGLLGIIDFLTQQMNTIYGGTIDFSSNTPDGQMIQIFGQVVNDVLQLILMVNAGFDPDQAMGAILYQRVGINGIQVQNATFSTIGEQITVTGACTLYGLDQTTNQVYTIQDELGNQWQLVNTVSIAEAGTELYNLQAANPGPVTAQANTVTIPVTTVLQVSSVTNPSAAVPGQIQETDAALKLRRQQSTAIGSIGYLPGTIAALKNISGISYANAYENDLDIADSNGQSPHSIWVVVAPGSATQAEIANIIYVKHNAGCGIYVDPTGTVVPFVITQSSDGNDIAPFVVQWNEVIESDLYISCVATSIDGENQPDIPLMTGNNSLSSPGGIGSVLTPNVGLGVNINQVSTVLAALDTNSLITFPELSSGQSGVSTTPSAFGAKTSPAKLYNQFEISPETAIITMGGIEQSFANVDNGLGSPPQELFVIGYDAMISAKQAADSNPISASSVVLFQVYGGYFNEAVGSPAATLIQNNSGSGATPTISGMNPCTVTYTAGATGGVYDVLEVVDSLGNICYIGIKVVDA